MILLIVRVGRKVFGTVMIVAKTFPLLIDLTTTFI